MWRACGDGTGEGSSWWNTASGAVGSATKDRCERLLSERSTTIAARAVIGSIIVVVGHVYERVRVVREEEERKNVQSGDLLVVLLRDSSIALSCSLQRWDDTEGSAIG